MHRPARVVVAGGILAVGLAIGTRFWLERHSHIAPPLPADVAALDADLAMLIQTAAARVRETSDSPQAWRELGMVYQANGMIELAVECHERAIELDGGDGQAWHLLAMCRSMLGDTAGAVEAAERAVDAEPRVASTHWRLGYSLLDLGELDRAEGAFRTASSIDANDPAAIVGLARVHLQRKENHEAAAILEHLLESAPRAIPNEAYVNRLLASAYRRLERDEQAEAALARSMAAAGAPQWLDPLSVGMGALEMNPHVQLQRAKAMVEQGYTTQGFHLFESLLQKYPKRTAIRVGYAAALSERGQIDAGIELLEQAKDDPPSATVHLHLGAMYLTKARVDGTHRAAMLDRAAGHAVQAIAADPAFSAPHALRGEVLDELGQPQQAIACYQQAIALDPSSAQWRFLAGRTWHNHGDHAQAAAALEQAVRLVPRHGEAWYLLAQSRAQLGQRPRAREALAQAERWLGPNDARIISAAQAIARLPSSDPRPVLAPENRP